MSADQQFTGFRCYCAHCMGGGGDDSTAWNRGYYVSDSPKIPLPPAGLPSTDPAEEPGYNGPRFRTLIRGDDWNGIQVGTPVLIPYTFATRALSNYKLSAVRLGCGMWANLTRADYIMSHVQPRSPSFQPS